MKLKKIMSLGALFLCAGLALAGCSESGSSSSGGGTSAGGGTSTSSDTGGAASSDTGGAASSEDTGSSSKESITIWCPEEITPTVTAQIEQFISENSDFPYSVTTEAVSESESATNMLTDVTAGADLFFFAQDQLARLVQAGALAEVNSSLVEDVTSRNDAGSVAAGTVNDVLYAYPLTSDNGYFMYYDKSVISDDIINDQTKIIAACEENSRTIGFQLTNSGWYNAAYFFGTGCVSNWETDNDGNFTDYTDTYNSANGIIAAKGMAELIGSSAFVGTDSAAAGLFGECGAGDAAVVVSGTWDYTTAVSLVGENLGCAKLWSFSVDGTSYQLGSFSGNKLLGAKPQSDVTKGGWCQLLANYLTDEECQMERFESNAWGPSNLNCQASEAVQANPALAALAAQSNYATPQGQFPNAWWDASKAIGVNIQNLKTNSITDEQAQTVLDTYTVALNDIMDTSFKGWYVVGSRSDYSWTISDDTKLTEADLAADYTGYDSSNASVGIWEITIEVTGDPAQFRICETGWSNNIGYSYLTEENIAAIGAEQGSDDNINVAAGSYTLRFDTTGSTYALTVTAA